MAITTNQPKKELLALKLGVLEQRVLQPPLLPALIFPDPPLEAIMPNCLLTQRRLRASWLLNLLNGLVSNLFGEVVSSWALLAIRDENRMKENSILSSVIQNHLKPGHGISSSLSVQSSWTLSNFLFVNIQRLNPSIELMLHNVLL
ncbi:uncharacterized protein LOC100242803 isoform X1 [Vitis vinifera]|uniref:uncharacterized protein LOC100242803 isoform X1 n=1 Tax=Vitis vinifera TaxID=29760 RepID=UPI0008FEB5A2|nr:uncharacterized protein LOC100242803 isoform X1 [Vitis vinifera]|eukprot:XP_019073228.1 PREDICTED: uncharacterized protein LOC100242803 isoform X1 [Vitis vinifera]